MTLTQRLANIAASALVWPFRAAAHRRLVATLGGFDDRALADIGLSRQDLRDATALPLAADPSRLFAARAEARAQSALRLRAQAKPRRPLAAE